MYIAINVIVPTTAEIKPSREQLLDIFRLWFAPSKSPECLTDHEHEGIFAE